MLKVSWFWKVFLVSSLSPKKRTKQFVFTTYGTSSWLVFVHFLEESEGTKKTFRNYLTFRYYRLMTDFRGGGRPKNFWGSSNRLTISFFFWRGLNCCFYSIDLKKNFCFFSLFYVSFFIPLPLPSLPKFFRPLWF